MMRSFIKLPLNRSPHIAAFNNEEKITFPNRERLIYKVLKLREQASQVDVIADFDHTLTQHRLAHQKCDSLFGMFVKHPTLKEQFRRDLMQNYKKYGPYQTDATLTYSQRLNYMNLLYTIQRNLFSEHNINADEAGMVLQGSQLVYRAYIMELIDIIVKSDLRLKIVSGGISDMIFSSLVKLCGLEQVTRGVEIYSNYWQQPKRHRPQILKFDGELVHSYNKHVVLAKSPTLRKNCILMGDLKSDIYMAESAGYKTVLSVFYGKEGQFDQRALAEEKFDVIIEGDSSHKMVIQLIKIITGSKTVDWGYLYRIEPVLTKLVL